MASAGISLGFSLAETGGKLVMGLLAAHDKRVSLAKEENAAVNQAVSAFDSDVHTIITALNSGDISEATAINALNDVWNWYWQFINGYSQYKNLSAGICIPDGGAGKFNPPYCQSEAGAKCTAGCCVGCTDLQGSWNNVKAIIVKHGGTATIKPVYASKYGVTARAQYTVTYTKPKVVNTPAEVTLNLKSGIVSVGAPPSQNDVVVARGVISVAAQPDQGGDVIQHNPAGVDVGVTSSSPLGGSSLLWPAIFVGAAIVIGLAVKAR